VVAVIQGTVFSFSAPARQALLPQLVEREKLGNAIALVSAGMSAPALAAPALGGLLYAVVGPEGVYFVVVALGVVAVALTTSIRASARPAERPRSRMVADIGEGLSYLWNHGTIRLLLIISLVFVMLSSPLQSLLPVLIVDVYGREAGALGLMVSATGIGALIGTLLVASLRDGRRGLLLMVSGFASAIALILVGALPFYVVGVAAMVLLGLGSAGQWSLNQVLLMREIDDRYRGRAMSVYMMIFGLMPLAVLPAALAVDRFGPPPVIGALGVALLALSTLLLFTQKRIRRLP
jgi:MFS family permease